MGPTPHIVNWAEPGRLVLSRFLLFLCSGQPQGRTRESQPGPPSHFGCVNGGEGQASHAPAHILGAATTPICKSGPITGLPSDQSDERSLSLGQNDRGGVQGGSPESISLSYLASLPIPSPTLKTGCKQWGLVELMRNQLHELMPALTGAWPLASLL